MGLDDPPTPSAPASHLMTMRMEHPRTRPQMPSGFQFTPADVVMKTHI